MSIIQTSIPYSSSVFYTDLQNLLNTFPFLKSKIIGYTVLGRPIYIITIGTGQNQVFYSAAFHANEWITTPVLMKFIEDISNAYVTNSTLMGYSINRLLSNTTIHLCPMVNPDGIDLVTGSLSPSTSSYISAREIASSYPDISFPDGWKANINGVDLNLQFPAGWQNAKEIKYSQGFISPSPRDFVGFGPLTEPEALAVYNYTLSYSFRLVLTYHTQGQEIYWRFQNYLPPASYYIGEQFANVSGYALADTPYNSSFAGFKDWFIQNYNLPGYTIEAGLGENPLPILQFNQIYQDNLGILLLGAIL